MTRRVNDIDILRHVPKIDLGSPHLCTQAAGFNLPIAVINLTHRPDRLSALSSRMAAVGLDHLIRVPAVYGADLSVQDMSGFLGKSASSIDQTPESHLTLTRPAIGCFMSHLAVWRWMIETNAPRTLVFEDDAVPAAHFDAKVLRASLAAMPDEAGLVFVGRVIMNGLADQPDGSVPTQLARLYYFNGTFAYLITQAACRVLMAQLNPPHWHIDHQISKVLFEQRKSFHAYYTEPHFFEPDWNLRSDCYVPLAEGTDADKELGAILEERRAALISEGRRLLSPHV
jgi:glycosyl transferase, family 25